MQQLHFIECLVTEKCESDDVCTGVWSLHILMVTMSKTESISELKWLLIDLIEIKPRLLFIL